jgi:hypothetical protein
MTISTHDLRATSKRLFDAAENVSDPDQRASFFHVAAMFALVLEVRTLSQQVAELLGAFDDANILSNRSDDDTSRPGCEGAQR